MKKRFWLHLVSWTVACVLGMAGLGLAHEVNKSAIAQLSVQGGDGETLASGTGFVVDPEGVLVTNYHVLVDAAHLEAIFPGGQKVAVTGVLKVDRVKDIAILQLQKGFYSTLELGDSRAIKEFDYVSALGYPAEQGDSPRPLQTYGFILGQHPQAHPGFSYLYTTAPFSPGFSGGPLVNSKNQVVGVATLEGSSINLALPVDEFQDFIKLKSATPIRTFLEKDRTSLEAQYYRGNFQLYGMGDVEGASQTFQRVIEKDPKFIPAYYDLAAAQRDMGRLDDAIRSYEKILEIHPDFPETLSNLGGFYFRAGKVEQALHSLKRAIAVYPNFIQALSNLGAVYNKLGQSKEALPVLQKSLRLDPGFAVAYFNLGNAYFALNRMEEALVAYNRSAALGADFLSLHWKVYEIFKTQGQTDQASEQLRIILDMDPENAEAKKKLAELKPTATPAIP